MHPAKPKKNRALRNLLWLTADKGIGLVNALLIGAWVARYLRPENVGILSYGIALSAMILPLVTLGADKVLVRDYLQNPRQRSANLWTAIAFRFFLGAAIYGLLALSLAFGLFPVNSPVERQVLYWTFLPLLFSFLSVAALVLEAEVLSKYAVWIRNVILLGGAGLKIYLITTKADLHAFAITHVCIELAAMAAIFAFTWNRGLLGRSIKIQPSNFIRFLGECWPLMIAGLSVTLFMNVDIAMLKTMRGETETGIYSVAVALSSLFYFLPAALSSSYLPQLLQHFRKTQDYEAHLLRFFRMHTLAAFLCVGAGLFVLPLAVRLLYGPDYAESARVLTIHIWSLIFVFIGVARNGHLVATKAHKINMWASLTGVGANVALNFMLIPRYGAMGAATATLVSYAISAFFSTFFWKSIRPIAGLQLKSLILPYPVKTV